MEELLVHLEFGKTLGIVALATIVATITIYFIFRKGRIAKYIPGLIFILIGLYNLYNIGTETSLLDNANTLFLIVITMISGFIGISTGLIIGIITKGRS